MRVVMFGYQAWGHRTLSALLDSEHSVAGVVTHPASAHAYEKIWADSVEDLARANDIPVHIARRPDAALVAQLSEWAPEIIVANNWRTWLPPEVFDLPPHGTLNVHDSLLPEFAGFSPVPWALISGASQVGLTAHRMDGGLDTGDIAVQRAVPIGPGSTGTGLVNATIDLIPEVVLDALASIEAGTVVWRPQDLARRTFFHKRTDVDSLIDWSWPAEDIDRLVRAMSDPYPSAHTYYRGVRVEITAAHVSSYRYGGTPGRIFIKEDDGMAIVAGGDAYRGGRRALVLDRVRTPDGIEQRAADYFASGGGYLSREP
ncbi:methionyl-tRNA formyltransferase [Rathayibacter sp. VKM Ac-2878]|nr:methionyl-tRNA formyltransferase [Rathayibacter sp. VKM Ac-2879]MBF4503356.1 methionyl-tRNA formyltransferase [Rathayibacter sp. VKM Ac-2878]